MTKWTCEDEKIVCKFYLKHKSKSILHIVELMTLLNNKFPASSVKMKLKNYEYLDTNCGLSNYSFLSKYTYRQLTGKGKKKGLSKAAKGIQTGDVANPSIRNILTLISVYIGDITTQDIIETCQYFNYKCPYTGRDLSKEILAKMAGGKAANIVLDHIVPQNKIFCGLNIKGNLIWVDKNANERKGDKSFEDFILTDQEILNTSTAIERQARIDKIKAFQQLCNYQPETIAKIVSPMLEKIYNDIQLLQIDSAAQIIKAAKL